MSKSLVTRLFIGGIVAFIAGIVLGIGAVIVGYYGNAFTMNGPDVTGLRSTPFAVGMVVLVVAAIVSVIGGAIAGLVSWVGALLNTVQLEDKTWFVLLLVLGIVSFGFIGMIAYVIAGPDGTRMQPGRRAPAA